MGLASRILKNTFYLTVGDKLGYVIQFIFFLYFARKFGVIPAGEYSFGFTYAYAFFVIADLGISVYLVREVARNQSGNRQLFSDCLVLRAISTASSFFLAAGVLVLLFTDVSPQKIKLIGFWGGYWIFYSLADVFLSELKGHEKMVQVALLGLVLKIFSTGAGILLIYSGLDYDKVLVVLPASSLLYLFICIACSIHDLGPFRLNFGSLAHYRRLLAEIWPFYLTIILVELLYIEDILILGMIKDDWSVGIYSSAIKIVSFIIGISPFFHVAMLPVLARLFVESKEKLVEVSQRALRYLVILCLPISVGLVVTSDQIIRMFYSEKFHEASIVLKITSWTIATGFIQAPFSVVLTAINRQKEKAFFIGINFGLSTILNLVFISYFDYIGAAAVRLAADILLLIFFVYLVSKHLAHLSIFRMAIESGLASILMGGFALYFHQWNLLYLVPSSAAIYVAIFIILGGLSADEMKFLKSLVRKKSCGEAS